MYKTHTAAAEAIMRQVNNAITEQYGDAAPKVLEELADTLQRQARTENRLATALAGDRNFEEAYKKEILSGQYNTLQSTLQSVE